MLFQGMAPTVFSDLADMTVRRPAYIIGFILYISANIGISLQNSYVALIVLRCLQSSGSSSTIALASGVIADISTSAERVIWMGWVTAGPM
jgi:MFS family permease